MGSIVDNSKIGRDACIVTGFLITGMRSAGWTTLPNLLAPIKSGYFGIYHLGWGGYWVRHGVGPGKASDAAYGVHRAVGGGFIMLDMIGRQLEWKWSATYLMCSKGHAYFAAVWALIRSLELSKEARDSVNLVERHDPNYFASQANLWSADWRVVKKGLKLFGVTLVRLGLVEEMPLSIKLLSGGIGTYRVWWNRQGKFDYIKNQSGC